MIVAKVSSSVNANNHETGEEEPQGLASSFTGALTLEQRKRILSLGEIVSGTFAPQVARPLMPGLESLLSPFHLQQELLAKRVLRPFHFQTQHLGESLLAPFHEQQQRLVKGLLEPFKAAFGGARVRGHIEGMFRAALPPNLRQAGDDINFSQVLDFLEEEGIPLYLIPRASVGRRLLKATSHQSRRKVLNDCFKTIVQDCEALLDTCSDELIKTEVHFVRDGLGALHAGSHASAQAIFTVTLDTLIQRFYPERSERQVITNRKKDGPPPDALKDKGLREAYVWLPIHNAHEEFWKHKGHRVPNVYSRHASVHGVSRVQFNKRNCIQSLMLVTSLIGYANMLAQQHRKRTSD